MSLNIIDSLIAACDKAVRVDGVSAIATVPVSSLQAVLKALEEQERSVIQAEVRVEKIQAAFNEWLDGLTCVDFATTVPAASDHGEVFELFVGTSVIDCGRIFALWDNKEQDFYLPKSEEVDPTEYVENTLYWRPCLPMPNEAFDVPEF